MKYFLLAALLALAGCGPQRPQDLTAGYEHAQVVTRQSLKSEPWPFTVDTVIVHCEKDIYYLVSTPKGATYALNGTAKSTHQYQNLEDIWLHDKNLGGSWRVDIGPILEIANKNCGNGTK